MADPIVVDDGASLRIRELGANTKLDGLLDGAATANNASGAPFNLLRIEHHFKDGTNHLHPPGGGGPGTTRLNVGDVITVTSASGHVVQATVTAPRVLDLDLTTGSPAAVEAKTQNGQRIYRVVNADNIQTVSVNGGAPIFDNGAGGGNLPSALTVVVIL